MRFKVPFAQIHALHLEMTATALSEGAGPGVYLCVRPLYMWLQVIGPEFSIQSKLNQLDFSLEDFNQEPRTVFRGSKAPKL